MKALTLEDLTPETGSFTLQSTGKEYRLRPVNLADEEWIRKHFGDTGHLQKIFKNAEFSKIAQLAFHQLDDEFRSEFVKQKVKVIDDNGNEEEMELGGWKLFTAKISGWQEKHAILLAMLQTIGVSRPVLDKIEREEAEKIQADIDQKKSQTPVSTGAPSSTSSVMNTAGL